MNFKYLLFFILVVGGVAYFVTRPAPVEVVEDSGPEVKTARPQVPEATLPTEPEPAAQANEPQVVKKVKAETVQEKDPGALEITQATEKEFLKLEIPKTLSKETEVRYQQVYNVYQKTSYYLNEMAAGNIKPTKQNLKKAFIGLGFYYKEVKSLQGQSDDALSIVEKEHHALFEEALQDLPEDDVVIVRQILKIQNKGK